MLGAGGWEVLLVVDCGRGWTGGEVVMLEVAGVS